MTTDELNNLIANELGYLYVSDDVEPGEIRIPAGCRSSGLELTRDFRGNIVMGGFNLPGAPKGLLQKGTVTETHKLTGETRICGSQLLPDIPGQTPILKNYRLVARVYGDNTKNCGIYVVHAVGCYFHVCVNEFKEHGLHLVECADCVVTASGVGDIGTEETGTGYGVGFDACSNCMADEIVFGRCRYGVSLSRGGRNNVVRNMYGDASVAIADVHGGGELNPTFSDIENVKLGNESWQLDPVNPKTYNCARVWSPNAVAEIGGN